MSLAAGGFSTCDSAPQGEVGGECVFSAAHTLPELHQLPELSKLPPSSEPALLPPLGSLASLSGVSDLPEPLPLLFFPAPTTTGGKGGAGVKGW